jgi:hypothetical protein
MLEYTEEDKSDEGPPSSSVVERSPAANKRGTADRLVYKLVKVCVPLVFCSSMQFASETMYREVHVQ